MRNSVVDILHKEGPCLSSDLSKKLVSRYKISQEAARQRISRTVRQAKAKQLAYLTFPSRDRFLYLLEQFSSPDYWDSLHSALTNSNSCYGLAFSAISSRGGVIPRSHFISACGSPIRQKKHIAAETVLKNLIAAGIVEERESPGIGKCIVLKEILDQSPDELKQYYAATQARVLVESILLDAVKDWLRKLGIASYDKVELRDQGKAIVSTFAWDLTAPSYLKAFAGWDSTKNIPKPAFITCDVLNAEVNKHNVEPFLVKCRMLDNLNSNIRYFHMIVALKYSRDAFNTIKKSRLIVPATPKSLFGEDIAEGLTLLTEVLTDAASESLDLDKFNKLFTKLGVIEGAAGNLRGTLFELFSAELTRYAFNAEPELNVICKADGKKAEIDVIAEQRYKKVHFIECKGYKPSSTLSIEEVKKWLNIRIPTIRSWALSESRWDNNIKFQFELWITGKLNPKSKELINKAILNTKKYKIVLRDSNDILKLTKDTQNKALIKIFREQFLKHPLALVEKDLDKMTPKKIPNDIQTSIEDDLDIDELDHLIPF